MPKYKVKPEMRHGVGGRYGPGELVELDERSAAAFSDKLELVEDKPSRKHGDIGISPIRYVEAHSESEDQPMPTEELVELSPIARWGIFDARTLKLLEGAGLETLEKIADATDDELIAINGIGQLTLIRIREQIDEVVDVDNEI